MTTEYRAIMREIDTILEKNNLNLLKEYLDKRDLISNYRDYKDITLFIMRHLLGDSNKFEIVKFILDYFPLEYINYDNYYLNTLDGSEESIKIFKYLYNYYEKNLTKAEKVYILFNSFNFYKPKGDLRISKFLIEEKKLDVNFIYNSQLVATNREGDSPVLMSYSMLIGAIMREDITKVKYILENTDFKMIDFQDVFGNTALDYAINQKEIFELLIKFGANTKIKNNEGLSIEDKLQLRIDDSQYMEIIIKERDKKGI